MSLAPSPTALGLRLILWVGRQLPVAPPRRVLEALVEAQVTTDANGQDGFRLSFALAPSGLDYALVSGGLFDPLSRVLVGAYVGVTPELLIDGIVTHQELVPQGGGRATLIVMGRDLGEVMNLEERSHTHPNLSDDAIVDRVVNGYTSRYGITAETVATLTHPSASERTPCQTETDLALCRRLAQRNGYLFFVEPLRFGQTRAYFGPPQRTGAQRVLSFNLGHQTNVEALRFEHDALAASGSAGFMIEPASMRAVAVPPAPSLVMPPLARRALELRTTQVRHVGQRSPDEALAAERAAQRGAPAGVQGTGELDPLRYGGILRARRPVDVRGAGQSYDGTYFVERVSHTITRRSWSQAFVISREGTGALSPRVRS